MRDYEMVRKKCPDCDEIVDAEKTAKNCPVCFAELLAVPQTLDSNVPLRVLRDPIKGASDKALELLESSIFDPESTPRAPPSLRVAGISGQIAVRFAEFGSTLSPGESKNASTKDGSLVVLRRDGVSKFASVANSQSHDIRLLVIGQKRNGPWPFILTDTSKEFIKRNDMIVVSVSSEAFERLSRVETDDDLDAQVSCSSLREACCAICLEAFESGDELKTFPSPCLHAFHEACILQWLNVNDSCPSCRHRLSPKSTSNGNAGKRSTETFESWYS